MKKLLLVVVLCFGFIPVLALAQSPLVPCDGVTVQCNFSKLLILATNILNFLLIVSFPLAAIGFAWAGFLFLSSAGSESQVSKAKGIFTKILIGFLIILSAWLIVRTVTNVLLDPQDYTDLLQGTQPNIPPPP